MGKSAENTNGPSRREMLQSSAFLAALPWLNGVGTGDDVWQPAIDKGLEYLSKQQSLSGGWSSPSYPVAVSALAATALICSGSTTTQGPYAKNVRAAVDYLLTKAQSNGLVGDPVRDSRYTYGHGFAMLFLSQVLGEEEDVDRRDELVEVLEKAVEFSVAAQTSAGGWGYVSSKSSSFDEGSTTITQVQGLRGCRNAGIVVPKEAIEKAKAYIYKCQNDDGGISYSSKSLGSSRPAITAAALAALYNAGDYESEYIPKMWAYCKKKLHAINDSQYGHWHYTYLYYAQVVYRQGEDEWTPFRDKLYQKLVHQQLDNGSWKGGSVGEAYGTAINLIILQLDKGYLPIYQK
ncbi:MAG: prenyltransferase/squalene oxidase repeat-containing protein [Planctomycetota bacterium]